MKSLKKIIFFVVAALLVITTNNVFSQGQSSWKLVLEQSGVNVYSKVIINQSESPSYKHEYYLFKYENTTKKEVSLTWKLDVYYNGNCRTCGLNSPNEYELELILKPGETKIGDLNSQDKIYKLFKKDLSKEHAGNITFKLNKFYEI
jgi:hypothetical protein